MRKIPIWKRRYIIHAHKSGKSVKELIALTGCVAPTIRRVLDGHLRRRESRCRNGGPFDRCPGCGGLVNIWPCLECTSNFVSTEL